MGRGLRFAARRASLLLIFIVLAASGLGPGRSAVAGLAEGLAAFDAGDLRDAYAEWLPLAEAGDPVAQVALAGLLQDGGPGLTRDLPAAVDWYLRAALQGDAIAQMNLGDLYARGAGVARDPLRALAWLSLAAEQGRRWAARRRDDLQEEMTPAERVKAAALAAGLRAGYSDSAVLEPGQARPLRR